MRLNLKFVQHRLVLGLVRLNFGNLLKFDGEESSREARGRGRDGDKLVFMYITVASSASFNYADKNYQDDGEYKVSVRSLFASIASWINP